MIAEIPVRNSRLPFVDPWALLLALVPKVAPDDRIFLDSSPGLSGSRNAFLGLWPLVRISSIQGHLERIASESLGGDATSLVHRVTDGFEGELTSIGAGLQDSLRRADSPNALPLFFVLDSRVHWLAPLSTAGRGDGMLFLPSVFLKWDLKDRELSLMEIGGHQGHRELIVSLIDTGLADQPVHLNSPAPLVPIELTMPMETFRDRATQALAHIRDGDVYQLQLGHEVRVATNEDDVVLYERLKVRNPSAFMFLVSVQETQLIGASPEPLVYIKDGHVEMIPLAGTARHQGHDALLVGASLRADSKERAEHVMLVDLCRNDLSRVCRPGTVTVESLMRPEVLPSVVHLASTVSGEVGPHMSPWQVLRAVAPAGTMTGTPKYRACELISGLELTFRGFYSGVVGISESESNMRAALIIRSIVRTHGVASVRASAGIVADSIPQREWDETLAKIGRTLAAVTRTPL